MESTQIISCKTIQLELESAMKKKGIIYPVHYLESGLHNTPPKLTKALQEQMDSLSCERVLLAMGYCGNSIAGVHTGNYELIIPKVDDCISLILGYCPRQQMSREKPTYFMSKGWLDGERNIWTEYTYTLKKYGKKTGKEIFDMMFSNYKRLGVLDCGCYDIHTIIPETEKIASTLGLEHQIIKTNVEQLCRLLSGPWDNDHYLIFPPHTTISAADLTLPSV